MNDVAVSQADATPPLTSEKFLEVMDKCVRRMAGQRLDHHAQYSLTSPADVEQEARYALLEVWAKYSDRASLPELCRLGNRAIHFHLGNLWYRERGRHTVVRGTTTHAKRHDLDVGNGRVKSVERSRRRRSARDEDDGRVEVCLVDLVVDYDDGPAEMEIPVCGNPLDRLVLIETAEEACRVLQSRGAAEGASASLTESRFKTKIRSLMFREGYKSVDAAAFRQREKTRRKRIMNDPTSVMDPDTETSGTAPAAKTKVTKAKKTEVAKAPKAKAEAKKKGAVKLTIVETMAACAAFSKDDVVTYKGGSRAAWLNPRTSMVVKGTVVCRGRAYLSLYVPLKKKNVALAPRFVEAAKK